MTTFDAAHILFDLLFVAAIGFFVVSNWRGDRNQ